MRKSVFVVPFLFFCVAVGLSAQTSSFYTIGRVQGEARKAVSPEATDSVSADSIDNTPRVLPYRLALSLPLKEIYVTSPFGRRNDPIRKGSRQVHSGIDLKARFEPVYSMLPGMVTTTSYSIGGGYYVTVDYGMFSCSFLHLSRIDVLEGQRVRAGQRIAISGNTGKRTTGPHLHLSCKWNDTGKYFDPKVLLDMIRYDKHL